MDSSSVLGISVRARRFVFTYNLSTPAKVAITDVEYGEAMERAGGRTVRYAMFQREVSPTTGMPHLQGFVCFNKPMRMNGIFDLGLFGQGVGYHLEVMGGSIKDSETYCSKAATRCPDAVPIVVSDRFQ